MMSKFRMIDFDREMRQLKNCFNSLDEDEGGSIGLEEMVEPLIGLGFVDTVEEGKRIIDEHI